MLGSYQTDVYRKLLLWITLALGYNFLFGIAGQVAFSHFTFYGIGAYAMVILLFQVGLPLPLAIVAGVVVCVVLALVVAIPATRLEGFYLALATLAFAQLFIVVLNEGGAVTGGPGGLANYRLPDILGVRVTGPWYTVVIVFLLLGTLAVLWRLDRSWFGRACRAVRDDPQAAQAMGINVTTTRIVAYAVTSALAGVAGMVYAFVDNTVNPPIFGLENAFLLLFMVIVGGSGSPAGAIVGAVLLYLLPFFLSPLIGHHHALVFGVVMVAVVLFQPKGLIGIWDGWVAEAEGVVNAPQRSTRPMTPPKQSRRQQRPELLVGKGLSKTVRRPAGGGRTGPGRARRRDPGRHRPQRRRQEHHLQHDCRCAGAQQRFAGVRRQGPDRSAGACDGCARHHAHVPAQQAVRQHDGARERDGRHAPAPEGAVVAPVAGRRRSVRAEREAASAPTNWSRLSAWATGATPTSTPCHSARAGCWRLHARWRPSPA